ncbi:MAG: LysE family transporter [Gemmatimonadales bacterium]|jgi:threonine/homoserine/homoserine lactone efflux protein
MNHLLLFLFAWGLGFVAAIPVGPSQIEMGKRAIGGHRLAAAMVVAGSASSDLVYGTVALFGIAPFLETPWVLACFNGVGVVVLWILAFLTLRQSRKPRDLKRKRGLFRSKRWAYVTGFSLASTNPPIILSWLLGVALAKRLGLASPFPASAKALFVAGGVLGLASYLVCLGLVLYRFKRFFPAKAIGRIYFWLGITLFALSFYFGYGVIRFFRTGA